MSESPERKSESDTPDNATSRSEDLFEGSPRSVERIDRVLSLVRREWLAHPDERFWQMTTNLAARMGISAYASVLEDDAFIEMLAGPASP